MDELLRVFALPVCMAACLCPLVSMCSHPSICPCICFSVCLFIYMPCFSVLVACVYTYSVCSPLWVQFHPYCNVEPPSGSVFLLSFLVNPSRTSPIVVKNPNHWGYCLKLQSHKTQFPMEDGLVVVVVVGAFWSPNVLISCTIKRGSGVCG